MTDKVALHAGEIWRRAIRGGAWVFGLRAIEKILGLARTIVLARLLAPADFGLFAIAVLSITALDTFSQTGFDMALIHKQKDTQSYLDTAWTIQVIRGSFVALSLFFAAPVICDFFGVRSALNLIRVMGILALMKGSMNIGVMYFQKDLEFNKQFAYSLSGTIIGVAVAVLSAIVLKNAWALVLGLIVTTVVQVVMSYIMHPYRPKLRVDIKKTRELFTFGRWVLGTNIVVFLALYGDNTFVGRMLGATALGFYQLAFNLSNLVTTEIAHVISQVSFPVYSKLQESVAALRQAFLQVLDITSGLALPLTVGVVILAPDFVRLFLGEKWMPMVQALRVLCISGCFRAFAATGGPLFLGVGRPKIDFWMNLSRVGILAVLIFPLTSKLGITGTAIAVTIGVFSTIPIWLIASLRIIEGRAINHFVSLFYTMLGSAAMGVVLLLSISVMRSLNVLGFLLSVVLGLTVYSVFQYFIWRRLRLGIVSSIIRLNSVV